MARPIEPTPPLSGEDAAALQRDLRTFAAPAEVELRIKQAKALREEYMRPKGAADKK